MTDQNDKLIDRSGIFIIAFQLEGLCTALRLTVSQGLSPSAATIAILKKLFADFESVLKSGNVLEGFPKIDDNLIAVDILSIAETLRASVFCFLTPQELDDGIRRFGFHSTLDGD